MDCASDQKLTEVLATCILHTLNANDVRTARKLVQEFNLVEAFRSKTSVAGKILMALQNAYVQWARNGGEHVHRTIEFIETTFGVEDLANSTGPDVNSVSCLVKERIKQTFIGATSETSINSAAELMSKYPGVVCSARPEIHKKVRFCESFASTAQHTERYADRHEKFILMYGNLRSISSALAKICGEASGKEDCTIDCC